MNYKKCIICNNTNHILAFPFNTHFNGKIFHFKKCLACKFTRISPYPNRYDLKKLYNNKSYHDKFYLSIETSEYRDSIKYLKKFIKKKIKILDFGSGSGHFIKEIENIHNCYGVEYNLETIKQLKKKFKKTTFITNNEIENRKYNNFFDIIHLGDVLEHVTAPDHLLANLHKKIKKNGFLYIEGPIERNFSLVNISIVLFGNIKKFLSYNYKNNFKPYHLYFCDFKNQLSMIKKNNKFEVLNYEIYETGWPYNCGGYVKKLIAMMAVLFSKLNIFGFKIGNRFRIILKKND